MNARIGREIRVTRDRLTIGGSIPLAGSIRAGEPIEPYRADDEPPEDRPSLRDLFGSSPERWFLIEVLDDTLTEFGIRNGDELQLEPDPAVDDHDRAALSGKLIGVDVPACGFMVGRFWPREGSTSLGYLELTGGVRVNLERTATIYGRIVGLLRPIRQS